MSAFAAATSSPAGHHPRLFFWRENRNDGAYGVPGNLGRHLTVAGGWAYIIAVPFLRESGPASNGTSLGSWVTFSSDRECAWSRSWALSPVARRRLLQDRLVAVPRGGTRCSRTDS